MPKLTNPYTAGDPVGKTAFFVGREDVLREVERVLRHPSQNAITLFGQRRIGKTSILQYLEAHLTEQGDYRPVYFDLMHKTGLPLGDILGDLARTIALKLNLPDPNLGNTAEKTFRESYLPEVLCSLPKKNSLVLLLDEFDVLADPQAEQQSKRQFFSYLRDLRQLDPQRLQFVFVLGRNMDDLDVVAQGLFKDLPSKRVSLLDQKDAEKLVRLSERDGSLAWTPAAVARIWELTSGHPYLTQALCSQIWEDAYDAAGKSSPMQPQNVESAVPGTLERSQNMFAWLWEGLGPAEKVVAAALAGVGQKIVDEERLGHILAESGVRILIGELRDAPQILQKWDILSPTDGGYRFRVELLRRWIAENKPLSRTQEELDRINPVANSLFEAARGLYLNNSLEQAEARLREALGFNPNHLRASELLAEILLGKGDLDEAQQVLERLEEVAPEKARRRLKQVYLRRAESGAKQDEKLKWYEKILDIFPGDPQADEARHQIYQNIGEQALQAKDFQGALVAFQTLGDTKMVNKILGFIRRQEVKSELNEITRLEKEKAYQEAYQHTQAMAEKYPEEHNWQADLERLQAKTLLAMKYSQALEALKQSDRAKAKKLLSEVIALEPDYDKQISRYFYWADTGDDPDALKEALAKEKAEQIQAVPLPKMPLSTPIEKTKLTPDDQPKPNQPRRLSPWNPLDYLRLLGWVFIKPEHLKIYEDIYGKDVKESMKSHLAYTLTFMSLLMPLLGLGLSMMPQGGKDGMILALGIAGFWLISLLVSDGFFDSDVVVLVVLTVSVVVGIVVGMASGIATIVVINVVIDLAVARQGSGANFSVTVFVAFGLAVGGAISMARGGGLEIALLVLLLFFTWGLLEKVDRRQLWSSGLSFGLFSGVAIVWLSGRWVADTWLQSVLGIVYSIVAGGIVLGMLWIVITIMKKENTIGKVGRWILLVLLLFSLLTLVLISFGGLSWWQTGTWPTPVWPF